MREMEGWRQTEGDDDDNDNDNDNDVDGGTATYMSSDDTKISVGVIIYTHHII